MIYSKYVKDVQKVIEHHTEKLTLVELTEAWGTIEDAPAFTGKIWIEDILDKVYNKKIK